MTRTAERRIAFARWRSAVASGGNRYDDELVTALTGLGIEVSERFMEGPWPLPTDEDRVALDEVLQSAPVWLIDNILASAAPDAVAAAVAVGHRVTVLVHYFPSDDPAHCESERADLARTERAAIQAATSVVATSTWTAGELARRYGRDDVRVAVPGVAPAPLALGTPDRPHFVWLARVTETKDPLTCVEALIRVRDHAWTAQFVGPDDLDPALSDAVRRRITDSGLEDRIEVSGPQHGAELDSTWNRTDLLIHTARTEPYGMVVTEAVARRIPSIVPEHTGAAEAQQGAGDQFPVGDAEALAVALEEWLTHPETRATWSAAARYRRERLPTWRDTAEVIADALS
ncbi:glycosyl transferase [Leucobacter sp. Psy1]|uniref:glycosyltransferase family 4 protein n=1 Tax=Leucobacter sp. Psy1 TaxID=2875729 RepID=UPI001CD1B28C|nr:glycosyltransferase family 4 protein [Leucobacter sp. Psy1]UBH05851.1 glycosyl transferase [Leucobacter sp. Psy1]